MEAKRRSKQRSLRYFSLYFVVVGSIFLFMNFVWDRIQGYWALKTSLRAGAKAFVPQKSLQATAPQYTSHGLSNLLLRPAWVVYRVERPLFLTNARRHKVERPCFQCSIASHPGCGLPWPRLHPSRQLPRRLLHAGGCLHRGRTAHDAVASDRAWGVGNWRGKHMGESGVAR